MPGATVPLGFPYPLAGDTLAGDRALWQQFAEAVDDYLAALSAVAAVAWTDLTLTGTWAHLGVVAGLGYTERSQYARRAGMVTVTLAQSKAAASVALETIATIPAGFRPSRPIRAEGDSASAARPWIVLPDGNIKLTPALAAGQATIAGTVTYAV